MTASGTRGRWQVARVSLDFRDSISAVNDMATSFGIVGVVRARLVFELATVAQNIIDLDRTFRRVEV
jgi:hypothetical protein